MTAPSFPGAACAAPFVDRWLDGQRGALHHALARCESPIEALFALALLSARDAHGPLFALYTSPGEGTPMATGRNVAITPQYQTRIAGAVVRLDLAIVRHDKRLAIELDGHAYHASAPARSADAARDLALTKAGWTPVRFTGADVWRDADGCAARALSLLGFELLRGEPVRPVQAPAPAPTMTRQEAIENARKGAAGVLAALGVDGSKAREGNR